jgi:hypothetical protein
MFGSGGGKQSLIHSSTDSSSLGTDSSSSLLFSTPSILKTLGLKAPLPWRHRPPKRQRKKVRSHSRPPSPQSWMCRYQIRGLQAPPSRRHRPPKRQRKKVRSHSRPPSPQSRMWRSQDTLPEEVQHNPLLPTSSEEISPPKSKIRGLQAPPTRRHRPPKRQRKKVRSHSRPPSPQSGMWRSQETLPEEVQHNPLLPTSSEEKSPPKSKIRGLQAPPTRRHSPPKRQRKKVRSHSRPPSPQSRMWRSQEGLPRRYSTTPCCPPAQRRYPCPHPRFGVYKHLRPGRTVGQKGSEKKSEVTAGLPDVEISDSGSTSTSDPAAPSAIKAAKKRKSQPATIRQKGSEKSQKS